MCRSSLGVHACRVGSRRRCHELEAELLVRREGRWRLRGDVEAESADRLAQPVHVADHLHADPGELPLTARADAQVHVEARISEAITRHGSGRLDLCHPLVRPLQALWALLRESCVRQLQRLLIVADLHGVGLVIGDDDGARRAQQ